MMQTRIIDPSNVRDLGEQLLESDGSLKVVPSSTLRDTSIEERAIFGLKNGIYGFLTTELIEYLKDFIGARKAIEIGAGHGKLAQALGIAATDNRMQERPEIAAYYALLRQPVVKYGSNVEKLDAIEAVKKHKPQVVVASWVTHKYDASRHAAGGNEDGVKEEDVIGGCDAYVFIGNTKVHANKSIWSLPHKLITPEWLYSRAHNGSKDFIAIWEKPWK